MSSQLPAFQGNVPVQLRDIHKDMNITCQGGNCASGTGWMDSLDPLYATACPPAYRTQFLLMT